MNLDEPLIFQLYFWAIKKVIQAIAGRPLEEILSSGEDDVSKYESLEELIMTEYCDEYEKDSSSSNHDAQ